MGELKDKAKGLGNEIAGNVKQAAGKVSDNQRLQAKVSRKNAKAKVRASWAS
jgi:uncharacterized protein YjbJ (UPF0337 family)